MKSVMKWIGIQLLLLIPIIGLAQDTICLRDNSRMAVIVHEIEPDFITYSLMNRDSVYFLVSRNDVQSIRYANGTVEEFSDFSAEAFGIAAYQRGFNDAEKYYTGGGDFTKGVLDGALSYIFYAGVVLIIIDYRKDPKLEYPYGLGFEDEPSQDIQYRKGYLEAAQKIKKRKLIGGYFTGLIALPIALMGVLLGAFAAGA
jgi:hypothetical protein